MHEDVPEIYYLHNVQAHLPPQTSEKCAEKLSLSIPLPRCCCPDQFKIQEGMISSLQLRTCRPLAECRLLDLILRAPSGRDNQSA